MTVEEIPATYTRMRIFIKNPTLDRLISAIYAMPKNLRPEYFFEYEPRPKSKRIYLTSEDEFRAAMQSYGPRGASGGSLHKREYTTMFDGFLPKNFSKQGNYRNSFDLFSKEEKDFDQNLKLALRAFDHFSQYFDTYHSLATPIRALDAIESARSEAFKKSPPFELFRPGYHTMQPFGTDHAKFSFPMLGWITYLSDEIISDYGLDVDELETLAWSFAEVGIAPSAGKLYRIQFWENRDDWQEKTPALIDICLRADQHRYLQEEYQAVIGNRDRYAVERWHEWLMPDRWWEGS